MGSIAIDTAVDVDYKLPRGGREAVRLTAQHRVLTSRQGWLLHPDVADAIKDVAQPRIADVATGTGIWAMELAQQLPQAEIIGLDISDQQFPPEWTWPENVSLGLYDLLEDVPLELRGAFDVVHVRLLLAAGPTVDKAIFIDRFRALLRPGGWLQWDELSFPEMVACVPSRKVKGTVEKIELDDHPMMQVLSKHLAFDDKLNWIHRYEEEMGKVHGLDKVERYIVPTPPHLLQMETDLCLVVHTELIEMLVATKKVQDPAALCEIRDALARLYKDVHNGVMLSYPWNVCLARKTLS